MLPQPRWGLSLCNKYHTVLYMHNRKSLQAPIMFSLSLPFSNLAWTKNELNYRMMCGFYCVCRCSVVERGRSVIQFIVLFYSGHEVVSNMKVCGISFFVFTVNSPSPCVSLLCGTYPFDVTSVGRRCHVTRSNSWGNFTSCAKPVFLVHNLHVRYETGIELTDICNRKFRVDCV